MMSAWFAGIGHCGESRYCPAGQCPINGACLTCPGRGRRLQVGCGARQRSGWKSEHGDIRIGDIWFAEAHWYLKL